MNKKGIGIIAEWIRDLILLMFVIAIFTSVVIKIKDDSLHNLRVEAIEYASARDALLTLPYQNEYNYKPRNENITISINTERCLIQTKYKEETRATTAFFCAKDDLVTLKEETSAGNTVRITKNA